jgi:hypothetical protein
LVTNMLRCRRRGPFIVAMTALNACRDTWSAACPFGVPGHVAGAPSVFLARVVRLSLVGTSRWSSSCVAVSASYGLSTSSSGPRRRFRSRCADSFSLLIWPLLVPNRPAVTRFANSSRSDSSSSVPVAKPVAGALASFSCSNRTTLPSLAVGFGLLSYLDSSSRSGSWLALCHGFSSSCFSWLGSITSLSCGNPFLAFSIVLSQDVRARLFSCSPSGDVAFLLSFWLQVFLRPLLGETVDSLRFEFRACGSPVV